MKLLLSILGLAAVTASALPHPHLHPLPSTNLNSKDIENEFVIKSLFDQFKLQYNKVYTPSEEMSRYINFRNSLTRIHHRNRKQIKTNNEAVFGITKFSDLSPAEFKLHHLDYKAHLDNLSTTKKSVAARVWQAGGSTHIAIEAYPANATQVDWRSNGAVTPVNDQQKCGASWAFSVTQEIESQWFVAHNELLVLSTQQILSCDRVMWDNGCEGGNPDDAYRYVDYVGGIAQDSVYPFVDGNGNSTACQLDPFPVWDTAAAITGFSYAITPCFDECDHQNEEAMASAIAQQGPAGICVDADTWKDYKGGVYSPDATECSHNSQFLDHCGQVVGFNKDASTPYWIVRMSWGTNWGVDGYMYLRYGTNACGVADIPMFAIPSPFAP